MRVCVHTDANIHHILHKMYIMEGAGGAARTDMPKELVPMARSDTVGAACSMAAGAPCRGTTASSRCLRRQSLRVDATYGFTWPRCITGAKAECLAACTPNISY